jgi:UDP-N-acetylglucosamine--N-acetylmuramyl-(pentapeptide) pyrophosphoryl-undecaprenol N-acetylglucosamine transferase
VNSGCFVMAGGGTGGHVIPAIAVANELKNRGHRVLFIGTQAGLEAKLVPGAGFPIEWIEVGGLNRVSFKTKVRSLWQLPLSVWKSIQLLRRHRADAVFSMGGFVAGPVMIAAKLTGCPVVLMEPNSIPGFTARAGRWLASRVLVNFEQTKQFFPKHLTEVVGLPVRGEFFLLKAKAASDFTVLVTGGSQGSRAINRAVRQIWSAFQAPSGWTLLHQCGRLDFADLTREFSQAQVRGKLVEFISDMPQAFSQADVVVCRAGAGALAELSAAGKPSILIPLPTAADDHQRHNAEAMAQAGAAEVLLESELTPQSLINSIAKFANNPAQQISMQTAARKMAKPSAAERAAAILEEVAAA